MSKKYSGGIEIATGFKLSNPNPIADYMVVELISDLTNTTILPNQYVGMETFVLEDENKWIKKTTGWEIMSGGSTSGTTVQDNIIKVKRINYGSTQRSNTAFANLINNLTQFTIDEKEIYIFSTYSSVVDGRLPSVFKFYIKNSGKGTYGTGGTQLTGLDIELMYVGPATLSDVRNDPSTQTIVLGEIGTANVWDVVNALTPSVNIQPQQDGYTIIETLVNGVEVDYLFVGEGGTYGSADLQSTELDYQLFSDIISDIVQDFDDVLTVDPVTDKMAIFTDGNKSLFLSPNGIGYTNMFTTDIDISDNGIRVFSNTNSNFINIFGNTIELADGASTFKSAISPNTYTTNRTHKWPNGNGTLGLGLNINGNFYPFNSSGGTSNIIISGSGSGGTQTLQQTVNIGDTIIGGDYEVKLNVDGLSQIDTFETYYSNVNTRVIENGKSNDGRYAALKEGNLYLKSNGSPEVFLSSTFITGPERGFYLPNDLVNSELTLVGSVIIGENILYAGTEGSIDLTDYITGGTGSQGIDETLGVGNSTDKQVEFTLGNSSTTIEGGTILMNWGGYSSEYIPTGLYFRDNSGSNSYLEASNFKVNRFQLSGNLIDEWKYNFGQDLETIFKFENPTGIGNLLIRNVGNSSETIAFLSDITGGTSGSTQNFEQGSGIVLDETTPNTVIISANGLESLDEGNGIGWRLIGRDPLQFGNIGFNAVDLSSSSVESVEYGATGENSFAAGVDNIASGYNAIVFGRSNVSSGQDSFTAGQDNSTTDFGGTTFGVSNQNGGYAGGFVAGRINTLLGGQAAFVAGQNNDVIAGIATIVLGRDNQAEGDNSIAIGRDNTAKNGAIVLGINNESNTTSETLTGQYAQIVDGTDSVDLSAFRVGVGYQDEFTNEITRKDGLTVFKSGLVSAPSSTNDLIDGAGSDALVTKGFIETNGRPDLTQVLSKGDRLVRTNVNDWTISTGLGVTATMDIERDITGSTHPYSLVELTYPETEETIEYFYLKIPPIDSSEKNNVWKYLNNTGMEIYIIPSIEDDNIVEIIPFGSLGQIILNVGDIAEIKLVKMSLGFYTYSVTIQYANPPIPTPTDAEYKALISLSISGEVTSIVQKTPGLEEAEFTITFTEDTGKLKIEMISPNIQAYHWNIPNTQNKVSYAYSDVGSTGSYNTLTITIEKIVGSTEIINLPFSYSYHLLP